MKCVFKDQDLQMFVLKSTKLEIVGRGSETQLQMGENLKKVTQRERVNSTLVQHCINVLCLLE